MARVFVTGSADGLGKMAAELMVAAGHRVVLHARNQQRAAHARSVIPGAEAVVIGDLSSIVTVPPRVVLWTLSALAVQRTGVVRQLGAAPEQSDASPDSCV